MSNTFLSIYFWKDDKTLVCSSWVISNDLLPDVEYTLGTETNQLYFYLQQQFILILRKYFKRSRSKTFRFNCFRLKYCEKHNFHKKTSMKEAQITCNNQYHNNLFSLLLNGTSLVKTIRKIHFNSSNVYNQKIKLCVFIL